MSRAIRCGNLQSDETFARPVRGPGLQRRLANKIALVELDEPMQPGLEGIEFGQNVDLTDRSFESLIVYSTD